jgi:hypothetical protein
MKVGLGVWNYRWPSLALELGTLLLVRFCTLAM